MTEPVIVTILNSKLQQNNPKFLETVTFMHQKYSDFLLQSINGNGHVMDLVNAWCKMGNNYSQEIQSAKDNLLDDRITNLAVENRILKRKVRELELQVEMKQKSVEKEVIQNNETAQVPTPTTVPELEIVSPKIENTSFEASEPKSNENIMNELEDLLKNGEDLGFFRGR